LMGVVQLPDPGVTGHVQQGERDQDSAGAERTAH
jgi:hypothetical protein